MNPEVFYLHIEGTQRGPYTIPQIDHLVNSGLVPEETTYWREGLEQWQPVLQLVRLRKPVRRWKRNITLGLLALAVLALGRVFGPVAVVGWRETAQYDYTASAAYWRARDAVRHQALPPGIVVAFDGLSRAKVTLAELPARAVVWLPGQVARPEGMRREAWNVSLQYDARGRQWSAQKVEASPP